MTIPEDYINIPDNHEDIPNEYNNKPLLKKYSYYNKDNGIVGCVGCYGSLEKNRRVLFFEYEWYISDKKHSGMWHTKKDIRLKKFPLYRLNKLLTRQDSIPVVIVENERSANAFSKLGICCVSPVYGFDFVEDTDWTPLDGLKVVYLIASNDEKGMVFIQDVYTRLIRLQNPPKLKIVTLPDQDDYDDPLDWLQKSFPTLWQGNKPVSDFLKRDLFLKDSNPDKLLPNVINDLLNDAEVFTDDFNEEDI